jgi:AcrR family transcriptional regulator
MTETRERTSRSHKEIMAAALELLSERGYMAVTIEAIATRAGAGKQTIYRWWSSKAALYLSLYEELIPPGVLDINTGSLKADLEGLFLSLFKLYRETGIDAALCGLIAEMGRDETHAKAMREKFVAGRRLIMKQILERALHRGELRQGSDPAFIADMITGAIWFRLLLGHAPLDVAFAYELTRQVMGENKS